MSRRANSVRNYGDKNGQIQRADRIDPFNHMQQMMMRFGGLRDDPFMNMVPFGFGRDPLQQMYKFSDMHKNIHQKGTQGSYVVQSFVSSSKMGPNGKVIQQNYFQNNMGQHRKGNTISQKQQAYKNNQGVNRIAQQRMLNDRGRKIVKQKIGNNIQQTNHYYNIDQQDAPKFDSDWRNTDNNMNFLNNHQKYLQQIGQPSQQQRLPYQPPQHQNSKYQPIHRSTEQPQIQPHYQQQQSYQNSRPQKIQQHDRTPQLSYQNSKHEKIQQNDRTPQHQSYQNSKHQKIPEYEKSQHLDYQQSKSNYSGNGRTSKKNQLPNNTNSKFGKKQ